MLKNPHSKRTHIFRVIGQFMAKSMLDSRIIDLHFNKIFLKLVLGEQVALTLDNLKVLSVSRGHLTLFTISYSSSTLTLRHLWRSCKGCPKNPAVERLVYLWSRHVSLY
jgi:hypothetical protein